jgi:hypothetical protein
MLIDVTVSGNTYTLNGLSKPEIIKIMEMCAFSEHIFRLKAEENPVEGLPARELTTTSEWLDEHGIALTSKQKANFERAMSDAHVAEHDKRPRKIWRTSPGGKKANVSKNGYHAITHEPLFLKALQKVNNEAYLALSKKAKPKG